MTLLPHKLVNSDVPSSLHTLLLNFGKGWLYRDAAQETLPAHAEAISAAELLQYQSAEALERRVRELTVKQLATMLRMQAPDAEEITMLDSLENLVLAGEIGYPEFIERVQHLFPRQMATLNVSMRMKVAALVL